MAGKIKIPVTVIVFLILLLAAASFGGWAFLNFQAEKTLNVTLQVNLDKLKQENKRIEVRLQDAQKANADLEVRFQEANKKADSLSQDIEKERAAKQDLLDQVGKFRQQLDRQKEEITILEKLLGSSQTEVNDLTVKLNKLNFKDKELEGKAKENPGTDKKIELGKIVVNPEPSQPPKASPEIKEKSAPAPGPESKVMVVNKEYNFVVLNVGGKDGVAVGDVYSLFHNNKPIGDVSVEKVHEAMAAAGFLNPETKDKVSEGDRAVLKGK